MWPLLAWGILMGIVGLAPWYEGALRHADPQVLALWELWPQHPHRWVHRWGAGFFGTHGVQPIPRGPLEALPSVCPCLSISELQWKAPGTGLNCGRRGVSSPSVEGRVLWVLAAILSPANCPAVFPAMPQTPRPLPLPCQAGVPRLRLPVLNGMVCSLPAPVLTSEVTS